MTGYVSGMTGYVSEAGMTGYVSGAGMTGYVKASTALKSCFEIGQAWSGSLGGAPAVDYQLGAGDVGRLIGGQI